MARVPNGGYPTIAPKAQPIGPTQISSPATAFGALTGQALQSLGGDIQGVGKDTYGIITDIAKENTQRQAKDLDNQYATYQTQQLYGDGTPNNPGLLNLKGQAAMDAFPQVQQNIATYRANLAAKAGNQIVSDLFSSSANERDDVALKNSLNHVSDQRQLANVTSSKVRVNNAESNGALGWSNPDNVNLNKQIVITETEAQAKLNGLDDTTTKGLVQEAVGQYWQKVIGNAMQTSAKAGQAMFNQNHAEIGGLYGASIQQDLVEKTKAELREYRENQNFAYEQKERTQGDAFTKAVGQVMGGNINELDIKHMADADLINGSHAENLLSLLNSKSRLNGPGNPAAATELDYRLRTNQATIEDVHANQTLNSTQMQSLMATATLMADNGGVLNRQEVKDGVTNLQMKIAGVSGPLAVIGSETVKQKLANAIQDFHNAVLKLPTDQQNRTTVTDLSNTIAKSFTPEILDSPEEMYSTLGKSAYFQQTAVSNKQDMHDKLIKAAMKLDADMKAGNILSPAYTVEVARLHRYNDFINSMSDKPAQVQTTGR